MGLNGISKIIEINKDRLIGNKELTNEILIDDIMINLGYNKKLISSVNREYNNENIDWIVCIDNTIRFILKTLPYNNDIKGYKVGDLDINESYDFYIVSNGTDILIYDFSIDQVEPIINLNVLDSGDIVEEVLENLSLDTYSKEKIIDIYNGKFIGIDKIENSIPDIKYKMAKFITEELGYEENGRNINTVVEYIDNKFKERDTSIEDELRENIVNLKNINNELSDKLVSMKDRYLYTTKEEEIKAIKLLETVKNNSDSIMYVAVINNRVVKELDIKKFICGCIAELYSIEGLKMLYELFAGNTFKLTHDDRGIIKLNNKIYDIDLEGLSDVVLLSKLMQLFNSFNHILFKIKVLESKEYNSKDVIIGVPLTKLSILWDSNLDRLNLMYIGTDSTLYDLKESKNYDSITASAVEYLISISEDRYKALQTLNNSELHTKNKYVVLKDNGAGEGIEETIFSISGIDSINKSIAIIKGISNILNLYTDEYRLYFNIGNSLISEGLREYVVRIEDFIVE